MALLTDEEKHHAAHELALEYARKHCTPGAAEFVSENIAKVYIKYYRAILANIQNLDPKNQDDC